MSSTTCKLSMMLCCMFALLVTACSTDERSEATAVEPDATLEDSQHVDQDVQEADQDSQHVDQDASEVEGDVSNEHDTQTEDQDDVSTSGEDGGTGGGGSTGVHPRWVLYDGSGDPVDAIVTAPFLAPNEYPAAQSVGTTIDPGSTPLNCASVRAFNSDVLPAPFVYHLPSGSLSQCASDQSESAIYLDSQCAGTEHFGASVFHVLKVGQEVLWPKGEIVEPDTVYSLDNGSCVERSNSSKLIPFQPVPAWIRDALPNPPYTVRPEY